MFDREDYRDILKEELGRRCEKNANYSLRAFARDLKLGSARLSEILNHKTGLSKERAEQIAALLGYNAEEKEFFCELVEAAHARSDIKKELAQARLAKFKKIDYRSLEVDHFKIISDWYHFAILELLGIKGAKSDPRWIAVSLGIQEIEAKLAIERMLRLGCLEQKRGKLIPNEEYTAVSSAVPSEAIRKFHRQVIAKALEAVDLQSVENRTLGATVLAVNRADLPKLREKLQSLRKDFNRAADKSEKKDSVYCLSLQFFELTRFSKEK